MGRYVKRANKKEREEFLGHSTSDEETRHIIDRDQRIRKTLGL